MRGYGLSKRLGLRAGLVQANTGVLAQEAIDAKAAAARPKRGYKAGVSKLACRPFDHTADRALAASYARWLWHHERGYTLERIAQALGVDHKWVYRVIQVATYPGADPIKPPQGVLK